MKNNNNIKNLKRLIDDARCEIIGGYSNTFYDYYPEDEEYIEALEFLTNFENVYQMVLADVKYEISRKPWYKNLKFEGNDTLEILTKKMVKKMLKEAMEEHGKLDKIVW